MAGVVAAGELSIQSFGGNGRLTFNTLNDGTNYTYRVEWAASPTGTWSAFNVAGAWLDSIGATQGGTVTSTVPMYYRVVASRGDYLVVDLSEGTNATSYPVTYYRTLADVPGGADNDAYKTTNLLMRFIPAGKYVRGAPANEVGFNSERQHIVVLTQPFYMGVYEVTQKQWERVMGDWPSYFTNITYRNSRPVEMVNYDMIRGTSAGTNWPASGDVDAGSFMGRLRERTGRTFDLPTEAQWEYACRAGTAAALNSGYNITNRTNDVHLSVVGRYLGNTGAVSSRNVDSASGTATVGSYLPNAWGLYDMHGNILEWCLDKSSGYPPAGATVTDPKGTTLGSTFVLRGGAWYRAAWLNRSAMRDATTPSFAHKGFGFRVAVPAE